MPILTGPRPPDSSYFGKTSGSRSFNPWRRSCRKEIAAINRCRLQQQILFVVKNIKHGTNILQIIVVRNELSSRMFKLQCQCLCGHWFFTKLADTNVAFIMNCKNFKWDYLKNNKLTIWVSGRWWCRQCRCGRLRLAFTACLMRFVQHKSQLWTPSDWSDLRVPLLPVQRVRIQLQFLTPARGQVVESPSSSPAKLNCSFTTDHWAANTELFYLHQIYL